MLTMLKDWQGAVEIDGRMFPDMKHAMADYKPGQTQIRIILYPKAYNGVTDADNAVVAGNTDRDKDTQKEYRITVKKYMTQKSNPQFDFMAKWNDDNPMPYRTMTGVKVKETRGMVYMKLHGDIWADKIFTCMCCGKKLTNPVSQFFGIGPECGGHNYVHPFQTEEELHEAVNSYKKHLQSVNWEGWVIKSAITEEVEV